MYSRIYGPIVRGCFFFLTAEKNPTTIFTKKKKTIFTTKKKSLLRTNEWIVWQDISMGCKIRLLIIISVGFMPGQPPKKGAHIPWGILKPIFAHRSNICCPRDVSLSDSKCCNGGHEWV